ncbi:HET-domain-containing protein [Cercophora samala]|uniref:HET-domain-containing protein n=1 Tax=Cercophora samala TaxID=330535 RepID=A0AA40DCL0_9PEZI|nr:HET-domain-containing protein [Cercophora samala]
MHQKAHDVQETKYRYRALEQRGNIRLLHLLPHRDQTGPLACRLLEYPLSSTPGESPGSSQRSHLYEALSYTWGDSNSNRCISVDSCRMSVTDNLYEALLALRDRQLSRVLWVDAICIDQGNDVEKQEQIGFMADIYSMASRVVVWLGTGEGGGEVALDAISDMAVCKVAGAPFNGEVSTEAMLGLLQRPWFNRIWVLQEVAAARAILVVCGSSSIDGYAFSLVLHSDLFRSTFAIPPELQNQLRPVTYTMGRAICRPRKTTGIASHDKSSLGELVDMYHTRQATLLHDKVFALLGMSLSNPSNEIPLDYSAGWDVVFKKLMRLLFGRSVSVETQSGSQVAGIQGLGRVLGKICRVELDGQNGQQKVSVIWLKESTTEDFAPGANWILPPSANSVREGDIVCIMKGASKPTIIRFRHGLFSVIVSTVSCYASEQTREFPHFFSLLDWRPTASSPCCTGRQIDGRKQQSFSGSKYKNAEG